MRGVKPRSSSRSAPPPGPAATPAPPAEPELPPWKAFVVQFSRDSQAASKVFAGRVEHLNTGRRARFRSGEDLLAVLTRLLSQLKEDK